MKTRYLTKTTAELNQLNLTGGRLAVDTEKKALRFYDGLTPGGFELLGTPSQIPPPGSADLIAGDTNLGFYGELTAESFITTSALSQAIGLSVGTVVTDVPTWLKVAYKGKTLYFPKVPVRTATWVDIYNAGAVYGTDNTGVVPPATPIMQTAQVTIGEFAFKVRLFKGTNNDPSTLPYRSQAYLAQPDQIGSDWNDIMIGITDGSLASYSFIEMGFNNDYQSYCQATSADDPTMKALRGVNNPNDLFFRNTGRAWRPVLELIT